MTPFRYLTAIVGLVSLTACAPNAEQMAQADFGATPEDPPKLIDAWLDRVLIDPDSKKVEITSGPDKFYWAFSNPRYGYLMCGEVNSKNRMGGYAGRSQFWAMIRDNVVVSGSIREATDSLWIAPRPCGGGYNG